jgi:hypothetical protein
MIVYMIEEEGRHLIGQFVREYIPLSGTTAAALGAKAGTPKRNAIEKIKRGDLVSPATLMSLGTKMGLPMKYLIYVGTRDTNRIASSGADPDVIRFTLDLIASARPSGRSSADNANEG